MTAAFTYWIRMLTPLPDQNRDRERRMFGEGNFRADRKRRKPKPIRNIPIATLCHALLGKDSRETIAVARIPRLVAATRALCLDHDLHTFERRVDALRNETRNTVGEEGAKMQIIQRPGSGSGGRGGH